MTEKMQNGSIFVILERALASEGSRFWLLKQRLFAALRVTEKIQSDNRAVILERASPFLSTLSHFCEGSPNNCEGSHKR